MDHKNLRLYEGREKGRREMYASIKTIKRKETSTEILRICTTSVPMIYLGQFRFAPRERKFT